MNTEPILTQFKHNADGAIKFLMQHQKGIAIGALHHPSVGDIDLIWGKEGTGKSDGFGLAKLVKFHPEVLNNLQDLLSAMTVKQRGKNRVILESKDHKAAISLNWFEQERKWLLSAYAKESQPTITTIHTDSVEQGVSLADRLLSSINELDKHINGCNAMKTEIITYNLRERGRKHRGQDRNFDTIAIAKAINGASTQERVKNRDMHGFYGHWARIKFGMIPQEGKIEGGKIVNVEPALVTTHLKAFNDGTIEHQAEFLPTKAGELAYRLFTGKTGGFSSAIDAIKPEFFGFDYVLEPNYTTNRGYTFDSVCEGGLCGALLPEEIDQAVYDEQMSGMMRLLDSVQEFQVFATQSIDQLNAQLVAISKQKAQNQQVISSNQQSTQQVKNDVFIRPKMIPVGGYKKAILDSAGSFLADTSIDAFINAQMRSQRENEEEDKPIDSSIVQDVKRHFRIFG